MQLISNPPVVIIQDNQQFELLVESWTEVEVLAIDTEFERRTTYYPILALVQIYDGQCIYLIDPLKVNCPNALRMIFANPEVVKIMHSAKEDLEVLFHSWNCQLKNLFDTQTAYAFITGNVSIGYAALVNEMCAVTLDKEETQSNWRARPLTETQLDYAAKDVLYLPYIHQVLHQRVIDADITSIFNAECLEMCEHVRTNPDYELDYRQAGDTWRLSAKQLALFKELYQWREQTAIAQDRTRNHIMKDHMLVQVADLMPQSKNQLQKIEGLHPKSIRLYSEQIIAVVNLFNQQPAAQVKTVVNPRDLPKLNGLSDAFLKVVATQAKLLGVSASILASKRLARKMAFAYLTEEPFPNAWFGWREELFKSQFDIVFAQVIHP